MNARRLGLIREQFLQANHQKPVAMADLLMVIDAMLEADGATIDPSPRYLVGWPRPIPVSELPEAEQQILLFDLVDGEWLTGMYTNGEFVARKGAGLDFGYLPYATHWIPLPLPPKPS